MKLQEEIDGEQRYNGQSMGEASIEANGGSDSWSMINFKSTSRSGPNLAFSKVYRLFSNLSKVTIIPTNQSVKEYKNQHTLSLPVLGFIPMEHSE